MTNLITSDKNQAPKAQIYQDDFKYRFTSTSTIATSKPCPKYPLCFEIAANDVRSHHHTENLIIPASEDKSL